MKQTAKRLLGWVLALVMVIGVVPANAIQLGNQELINTVTVKLDAPTVGKTPKDMSLNVTTDLGDVVAATVVWVDDSKALADSDPFEAGTTYTANICLGAKSFNGRFISFDDHVTATLNGNVSCFISLHHHCFDGLIIPYFEPLW